jgi:hypothetical protein
MKKELVKNIKKLINKTKKEKIFFLLGHLPLDYFNESFSYTKWGNFSEYTFRLGLEIAAEFINDKKVEFLFLIDDKGTVEEIKNFNSTQMSRIRKKVYAESEEFYNLYFKSEIEKAGFSEKNIILQKSEKKSKNNLKLHSELLMSKKSSISNICAGSYHEIVKKFGDDALVVSFIPMLCQENICMTAMGMLDLNSDYELINCFMEVNKKSEREILKTSLLKSSFSRNN